MFWCWLILLFGTEVAFAHQNLDRLSRWFQRPALPPEPVDEYLGLAALLSISARFHRRQPPLTLEEMAEMLPSGNDLAGRAIKMLQDCNLVVEVAPAKPVPSPQFLPNLPLDQVTVAEVLACLRRSREAAVNQALTEAEPGLAAALSRLLAGRVICPEPSRTLKEVVESLAETETARGSHAVNYAKNDHDLRLQAGAVKIDRGSMSFMVRSAPRFGQLSRSGGKETGIQARVRCKWGGILVFLPMTSGIAAIISPAATTLPACIAANGSVCP